MLCEAFAHTWTLDISDDASRRVLEELDTDLCDTTSRTYDNQPSAMWLETLSGRSHLFGRGRGRPWRV